MSIEVALEKSYWPADNTAPLREITLGGLLREVAAAVPDRVALVDAVADPAQRRRWTYAQFLAEAEGAARAFLRHFTPGDRIAFCAANCAEWLIVQHGLSLAGMVLVPINPAFRERELETIFKDSEAVAVFYQPKFRDNDIEAALNALAPRMAKLKRRIRIEDAATFLADHDPTTSLPEVKPDQILQIQFTSGTTGRPKGACLHHLGTINSTRFVAERAGFPDGGVWLNAMPMFHVGGNIVTGLATLNLRGTYVLAPAFEPALILELIESERANASLIVPTMILALLEHPDFPRRDHSSMKTVLTGASTVPEALVARTKTAFGCNVVILFGQTELNGVVTATTLDDANEDQAQTLGAPAAHRGAHRRSGDGRDPAYRRLGRNLRARLSEHARLLRLARTDRIRHRQRGLAAHGRPRQHGPTRLPAHHRPSQGHGDPRRHEHLSPRDRRNFVRPSQGRRCQRHRPPRRALGRNSRRCRTACRFRARRPPRTNCMPGAARSSPRTRRRPPGISWTIIP